MTVFGETAFPIAVNKKNFVTIAGAEIGKVSFQSFGSIYKKLILCSIDLGKSNCSWAYGISRDSLKESREHEDFSKTSCQMDDQ